MAEAKVNPLYEKPNNRPKPKPKFYGKSNVTMDEFWAMNHTEQMALDARLAQGRVHELRPDHDFGKPYWVSKKPKP